MGMIFDNKVVGAYLCSCHDIITKVNNDFISLTGFTMDELLGKSLIEIGDMLKLNSQILLKNICIKYSGYIFTKLLSAREVAISISHDKATNVTIFTFIEKPNSRLKDKLIFVEQTFIENISGVAVYSVPDLILLKANQKYLEFMDFAHNKEENSIGKSVTEIITAFTGSQSEIIWNTVLQSKKSNYTKEFEFDPLGRDITYWDFTKTPIFENGELKYIFETSVEVTKRVFENRNLERQNKIIEQQKKQLEQQNTQLTIIIENLSEGAITSAEQSRKIEEQKNELEAILENITDGITIFDNKGQYILINKSAREMYFPSSNSPNKIDAEYIHSEFYDTNGRQIASEETPARVMKGEKFKNMRLAVKFPHKTLQIDVSGTPIYDSEGKFTLGVLCSRDMTAYYNHEGAIRGRYEFLSRMIDTFDLPVLRLSCPDLRVVEINKKAFNIIKLLKPNIKSINEIKDNTLEGLFKILKTNEYNQCICEVLKEKKTKYLNKQKLFINENEIYWNIIFEPILDMNGEIQEVLVLVIDVTAEITSNIIMEKALKSQGEFLVNISHELKTPLNVIFAAVQLFSMYCESGSLDDKMNSIIKYLESIKQNAYRLNKLINNIIDLSKIESGFFELNLSNNNIVDVVEEIVLSVSTFTDSKGLNIIFDTDIEEKIIACDPEKIERIVLNLISNAIKFSGEGDEILVSIKNIEESVQISVEDNGIGIEGQYLDMIFDRFRQVDKSLSRNAEGTGIGLSLVKSIVELHGGVITVESELGRGSKFTVILPSRSVSNENMIYSSIVKSEKQTIQVELSDVY